MSVNTIIFSYKAINMPKRHRLAFFDAQERPKNRVCCWFGNLSLIYINLVHIRSQKPRKVFSNFQNIENISKIFPSNFRISQNSTC